MTKPRARCAPEASSLEPESGVTGASGTAVRDATSPVVHLSAHGPRLASGRASPRTAPSDLRIGALAVGRTALRLIAYRIGHAETLRVSDREGRGRLRLCRLLRPPPVKRKNAPVLCRPAPGPAVRLPFPICLRCQQGPAARGGRGGRPPRRDHRAWLRGCGQRMPNDTLPLGVEWLTCYDRYSVGRVLPGESLPPPGALLS